jgi:hypothetical protein
MAGGIGAYPEHHFRRVIPGDIETVRQKLCEVLQDFKYVVVNENPIQAKRPRRKSIWVSMVLDYDTVLTIGLKPISPASTLATFDYAVEQLFTKAEMRSLEREAEAIIAMATAVPVEAFCPSCGAETAGAVRFCRACGKPIARNELPAELDLMRLTASASGSQIEIRLGLIICLGALLTTLPMILFSGTKGAVFGWILLALGEALGFFHLRLGMRRLHKALNPNDQAQQDMRPDLPRATSVQERAPLPPQPVSITEGTTELIESGHPIPAGVRPVKDTDSLQ